MTVRLLVSAVRGKGFTALLIFRDCLFNVDHVVGSIFGGISGLEALGSCSHESGLLDSCLQIHNMCSGPAFPEMQSFQPGCFKQWKFLFMFCYWSCFNLLYNFFRERSCKFVRHMGDVNVKGQCHFFCLGSYRKGLHENFCGPTKSWWICEHTMSSIPQGVKFETLIGIASWKLKTRNSYYKVFLLGVALER